MSVHFYTENVIPLFYKTSYFNEEAICAELSLSARVLWGGGEFLFGSSDQNQTA
jgi:hypothetical protein